MRRHAAGVMMVSGCLLLMVSGCAKNEMVKKDTGMSPVSASAKPPVKTELVKEQPVKKDTASQSSMKESAMQTSARESKLQATLQTIYFDFDSYNLSASARASLVKNAESLKKDAVDKVRIEGNCDERGSDEYNLALGERRAKAAMQYLVTMGISADRLTFISYGKEKPVDPGHDDAAWAKNRRDDFIVVSK